MIPIGAKVIEDNRRLRGLVPDGPLIISLIGRLPWWPEAAVVIANLGREYRWDWLRGLEVHVFGRRGMDARDTLMAILKAVPQFQFRKFADTGYVEGLLLWDLDQEGGSLIELEWPNSFYDAIGALVMVNDFDAVARVSKARHAHPGLKLKSTPLDERLNRTQASNLAWLKEAA